MSFSGDIGNFAKKTKLTMHDSSVAIFSQATTGVIKRTAVREGRARGNWYATINEDTSETSETRNEYEALSNGLSVARDAVGEVFNLTNNLPYIYKLEYMHWSKQSPDGMVRITAAEISQKLKRFGK